MRGGVCVHVHVRECGKEFWNTKKNIGTCHKFWNTGTQKYDVKRTRGGERERINVERGNSGCERVLGTRAHLC